MLTKEYKKSININESYALVTKLTGAIFEAKDRAFNNKDEMKKITLR
jgi:hypothetical protein